MPGVDSIPRLLYEDPAPNEDLAVSTLGPTDAPAVGLRRGRLLAEASGGEADSKSPEDGKGEDMRRGRRERPPTLIARMLEDRERFLLERVARGEDPTAIEAGDCGCAAGSMIELARSLARDRERLEGLQSEMER